MRGRRRAIRVGVRAVAATLLALAAAAPAAAAPAGPLGHEGRWITDAHGRVVVLHGFNMVDKLPPYQPGAIGFGEDDARFLAEHGFNTVRLGVVYKGLEPEPGQLSRAYLEQTAATVELLARHGIFTLLDFHQDMYNERFNGEGFPDWAVVDDGLPAQPDFGFPANYLVMPALNRAYDNFWANAAAGGRPLQNAFGSAWRRVAERFRGQPGVLGYNLLNEPWPGSQYPSCLTPEGCPAFDLALLTPFSKRVIAEIRKADPSTLVWYAPNLTFDFGARTWHGDTGDARAGFAFNNYCLGGDPLPAGELEDQACGATEERVFELADEHSRSTGDALLMTEFAATDDLPTIHRMVEAADRYMVSWQQWSYYNRDPSGPTPDHGLLHDLSKPPQGANVKREKLAASARAYPQAVAGTPLAFDFDADDKELELRYTTTLPGGASAGRLETEVFAPALHYPSGYDVEAPGAELVSARGARVARLRACPGVAEVRVRIVPARGRSVPACPAASSTGVAPGGRRAGAKPPDDRPERAAGSAARARPERPAGTLPAADTVSGRLPFTGAALAGVLVLGAALAGAGRALGGVASAIRPRR